MYPRRNWVALILRSYMTRLLSQWCEINVLLNCVLQKRVLFNTAWEQSKVWKYKSILREYVLENIDDIRAISKWGCARLQRWTESSCLALQGRHSLFHFLRKIVFQFYQDIISLFFFRVSPVIFATPTRSRVFISWKMMKSFSTSMGI